MHDARAGRCGADLWAGKVEAACGLIIDETTADWRFFGREVLVRDSWNLRGRVSNYRALNLGELGIDKRFIVFFW